MTIRTNLLNGNVINKDSDFSKYIETVSEPWVIEWLSVSTTEVSSWKARVPCLRSNGEKLYALVSITSAESISWEWDVYIEVKQSFINDWELANDDWTGIAEVKVWTIPENNALLLATIDDWVVEDKRNMIKKVWELYTAIQTLQWQVRTIEEQIDFLVNESASSLKEAGVVGEKYLLSDDLFRQKTPVYNDATENQYVWNENANKEIHIQRIGSWTASNKIYLKVKSVWSPTTWLIVEVRKWIEVDVSDDEAYWYWWSTVEDLICSWTIPYSWITWDYQMLEVTTDAEFWGNRWELLDIVVYQTGNIVNASNYYVIACDWSQYSEWFSLVSVNGTARSRSKLCPYCVASGFLDMMLCKVKTASDSTTTSISTSTTRTWTSTETYTTTQAYSTLYLVMSYDCTSTEVWSSSSSVDWVWQNDWSISVSVWWTTVITQTIDRTLSNSSWNKTIKLSNIGSWTEIGLTIVNPWYWTRNVPWVSYYNIHSVSWSLVVSPNQRKVVKPLKPVENKSIGQETYWISYWRLNDWTWYWEFDWEIYESATTWSITLWNCLWFKVITDANWEQYKIPIYWI